MPAAFHINSEDEFITFTCNGAVTLVDLYELLREIVEDPGFQPAWPQLIDLREMDLDLKPGALKPFVKYLTGSYRPRFNGAAAVVLDESMSADFCAGIYRLACSLSDTEVFDDYGLAIKWLLHQGWQETPASNAATASL